MKHLTAAILLAWLSGALIGASTHALYNRQPRMIYIRIRAERPTVVKAIYLHGKWIEIARED